MSFCELSFDPGQVNAGMVMVEYIKEPSSSGDIPLVYRYHDTNSFDILQTPHPHKEFLQYLDEHPALQEHLCDAVLQGMHRLSKRIIKHATISKISSVENFKALPKKTQATIKREEKTRIKRAVAEAKNEDNYKVIDRRQK
jgi:hypothetical protein